MQQRDSITFITNYGGYGSITRTLFGVIEGLKESRPDVRVSVGTLAHPSIDFYCEAIENIFCFSAWKVKGIEKAFVAFHRFCKRHGCLHLIWHALNKIEEHRLGHNLRRMTKNVPVIVVFHQGFLSHIASRYLRKKRLIYWYHYEKIDNETNQRDFNKAIAIVSLTPYNRDLLKSKWPAIPRENFYSLEPPLCKREITEMDDLLDEPAPSSNGIIRLLTVGHGDPVKGFATIISVAKILKPQLQFKWVVAGGGELSSYRFSAKNEGVDDCVSFIGPTNEALSLIRNCSMLVSPSLMESYGLAINEALYLKKPVVSTKTFGAMTQIAHLKNGILVGFSSKEIADGIISFFSNERIRASIEAHLTKFNPKRENDEKKNRVALFFEKFIISSD